MEFIFVEKLVKINEADGDDFRICFSRIDQIFPAETAILHLSVETGASVNPFIDNNIVIEQK